MLLGGGGGQGMHYYISLLENSNRFLLMVETSTDISI